MKYIVLSLALAVLTGCGSDNNPSYLNNKVLYDKSGCAFMLRKNIGDAMFTTFIKDLSKPECFYQEK